MPQVCPSCGSENPPDAKFCHSCSCGTNLVNETGPNMSETPEFSHGADLELPQAPRRRRWRLYATGCFLVLLLLVVGGPIAYLLLLRPLVEREVLAQVERGASEVLQADEYRGRTVVTTIREREFNQSLEDLWSQTPFVREGYIDLQQDLILITITALDVPFQIALDIRANDPGDIVVKSIGMNAPTRLIFTEEGLRQAVTEYVNLKFLRPSNVALRALQVTDGEILVVFEAR